MPDFTEKPSVMGDETDFTEKPSVMGDETDFTVKPSVMGDETGLRELWKRSFGDDGEFIGLFFDRMYTPGTAAVLKTGGKIVSAMHMISGLTYRGQGAPRGLAYAYALGTLPEYRGRGCGAMVNRELVRYAFEAGYDAVSLLPSEDSLYGWYERTLGASAGFWVREALMRPADTGSAKYALVPASAVRYADEREALLAGSPHVSFDDAFLGFAGETLKSCGGGFFLLDSPDCAGCAAVERFAGGVFVRELILSGGDVEGAAGAIAGEFGVLSLTVRCPAFQRGLEGVSQKPFAVVILREGADFAFAPDAYFGFALD